MQIDDREMAMYTPNEMAEPKEDDQEESQPTQEDN